MFILPARNDIARKKKKFEIKLHSALLFADVLTPPINLQLFEQFYFILI